MRSKSSTWLAIAPVLLTSGVLRSQFTSPPKSDGYLLLGSPNRGAGEPAPHASEVSYVFGTLSESHFTNFGKRLTPEAYRLSSQMNNYWVNFAKTSDPNGPGLPHWPVFTNKRDELMNFNETGPKGESDPWVARINAIEKIQK